MIAPWACSSKAGAGYSTRPDREKTPTRSRATVWEIPAVAIISDIICSASNRAISLHASTNGDARAPKMTSRPGPLIRLNGVQYRWPDRPVVIVCNDGGDPAYFDQALKEGIVPNVA